METSQKSLWILPDFDVGIGWAFHHQPWGNPIHGGVLGYGLEKIRDKLDQLDGINGNIAVK